MCIADVVSPEIYAVGLNGHRECELEFFLAVCLYMKLTFLALRSESIALSSN